MKKICLAMKALMFFSVLLLLISCKSEQDDEKVINLDSVQTSEELRPNYKHVNYYNNRQIKFVQEYYNDIKHGIYKNWYENGSIRTMGLYHFGFRKGIWNWYNEKGKLEFQVNYDKQMANL